MIKELKLVACLSVTRMVVAVSTRSPDRILRRTEGFQKHIMWFMWSNTEAHALRGKVHTADDTRVLVTYLDVFFFAVDSRPVLKYTCLSVEYRKLCTNDLLAVPSSRMNRALQLQPTNVFTECHLNTLQLYLIYADSLICLILSAVNPPSFLKLCLVKSLKEAE
jgi:hypothetical protein